MRGLLCHCDLSSPFTPLPQVAYCKAFLIYKHDPFEKEAPFQYVSYTMLSFSQQLKKPGSHREQCGFPNRCENETSCGQQYISCKDGEMIMPPEKVGVVCKW